MYRVTNKVGKHELMGMMDPLIAEWFSARFHDLTEPQSYAVPIIHERRNVLVSSPTGSGKTLTAFLSIINELFKYSKEGKLEDRIYAVYISPLKALANDINKNLEQPLSEMRALASAKGISFPEIRVGVRSGDTSQAERQKQLRRPPHIFITTPESLAMVLAAPKFREKFANVEYLIIDEIHEVCDSKRGVFLSLTLERMQAFCAKRITRIGLSATLAPIEEIAGYLVGAEDGAVRDVGVIEVKTKRDLDLKVICPTEDITTLPYEIVNNKMYDQLKEMIDRHATTIIFTNTRSGTESVVYKLKERGLENIEAHHGSLSKDTRLDVEARLKNGELKCVVSSTSLELGIDIGSVDLVCQIGSPKSVAKGLQRIGRSGHSVGKMPKGRMMVFDLDDLVECAVLCRAAHHRNIDRVTIPRDCLDVLAQSIVGMSLEKRWGVSEALKVIRSSYCYKDLSEDKYMSVLRYLGARDAFENVYSKIWLDEEEGTFGKKKGARMIYFLNLGTIPEEAAYKVFNEKGAMVGDLSEKFVERLAPKDVFVLGGRSYEFIRAKGMRALVRSAQGRKPTVPSWTGEMLPRSFDLSMEVARFRREMAQRLEAPEEDTIAWLCKDFDIDHGSARSILSYFREQRASSRIPDDKDLLMEGYIDKAGNHSVIFHFPFGRRVNDALSRAFAFKVTESTGANVSVSVVDDAFMVTSPRKLDMLSLRALLRSSELEGVLRRAVKESELFKQRFRHTAARSFMILRNYKGQMVSINRQQVRSQYLLDALEDERYPVIEETYREVLEDVMDIRNAALVLKNVEDGSMRLSGEGFASTPSPFGHNVVLAGISDVVLMEDRSALLKELHRRVLAKVMGPEAQKAEFEEEQVLRHFRAKIGTADTKEGLLSMVQRTGPMHLFKEKGRNPYPYCAVPREQVDAWADELIAEGRLSSVMLDDLNFVFSGDLPAYVEVLRRGRSPDERLLSFLTQARTSAEVEGFLGVDSAKALRALRSLEACGDVGRASREGGKWRYQARAVPRVDHQRSLDAVLMRHLGCWAPVTAEEVAFALSLDEAEVRPALKALVEEGEVVEGHFLISDGLQYMPRIDHLRLRGGGKNVFDGRTVAAFRRARSCRFGSIVEGLRHLGEVGMLLDLARRVEGFAIEEWQRLRREGRILLGRFSRGRVRYVLAEDAPIYVAAYRSSPLSALDERVLDHIRCSGGETLREAAEAMALDKEQLREAVDRLDRNLYIIRRYEEGEDWSKENTYQAYEAPAFVGEARYELVKRFLKAYGPVPPFAIKVATDTPMVEVEDLLRRLGAQRIFVDESRTEMVLLPEDMTALEEFQPAEEGMQVVSLYDPAVQPMWSEIAARYGDGWIFPVLKDGRLVGAAEKWEMSGCIEVRSLDLDDEGDLDGALKALDDMMAYYRMVGFDILRLKEVLGKDVGDAPENIRETMERNSYLRLEGMYAKGGILGQQYTDGQLLTETLRRQHVIGRYPNVHEALRVMGGLRGDAMMQLRCEAHASLRALHEQGWVFRGAGIPDFATFMTMDHAALCRRARDNKLTEEMSMLLRIIAEEGPVSKQDLLSLSIYGEGTTKEAVRALTKGGEVVSDAFARLRKVRDIDMTVAEARLALVRHAFRNFGVFSAEQLSTHLRPVLSMRETRRALAILESEGFLRKGFLRRGSDTVMWVLAEDIGEIGPSATDSFVLTTDDNLSFYLYPQIRERFGGTANVIFRGTSIAASFQSRTRGKDIVIIGFDGGREEKRLLHDFIRSLGLTQRESFDDKGQDYDIQDFYDRFMAKEE
jgi:ATP-dependent Lhr-like helicase